MNITLESKVGEVASQYPLSTRVFSRHNIDFCCGGGKPIADACNLAGVAPQDVLAEIHRELSESKESIRWDTQPLSGLIDHILDQFHAPLQEELPRLEALAEKVHRVHRDKAPEMLSGILQTFRALRLELEQHMLKEERVLFPMILAGQGTAAAGPVNVMEIEHQSAGGELKKLRELTDNFQVPEGACNSWRALWAGLEAFEGDMHEHIHLENNILFPRALAGEGN